MMKNNFTKQSHNFDRRFRFYFKSNYDVSVWFF